MKLRTNTYGLERTVKTRIIKLGVLAAAVVLSVTACGMSTGGQNTTSPGTLTRHAEHSAHNWDEGNPDDYISHTDTLDEVYPASPNAEVTVEKITLSEGLGNVDAYSRHDGLIEPMGELEPGTYTIVSQSEDGRWVAVKAGSQTVWVEKNAGKIATSTVDKMNVALKVTEARSITATDREAGEEVVLAKGVYPIVGQDGRWNSILVENNGEVQIVSAFVNEGMRRSAGVVDLGDVS